MADIDDAPKYLFGPDEHHNEWRASDWTASDDSVRGGKSFSRLEVKGDRQNSLIESTGRMVAVFTGELDITALGGAGFASQRTVDDYPEIDFSGYDALVLDVRISDKKKYTLILKDEILPKRDDGREQSTTSWEHDFQCPGHNGSGRVVLNFKDFKPMYRGKPQDNAKPLDLSRVKRVSIMIRSFFGKQHGTFSLTLLSIAVVKHKARPGFVTTEKLADQAGHDKAESATVSTRRFSWLSKICTPGRR